MSTAPSFGGERCTTCGGSGVHDGKTCPVCGGYGHLADGSIVLIPRPNSVTLTREQCEQLLANNGMTVR
ncbi:MAG TPA: hypothetical protein VEK07_13015 [Polyangiaceae bacterium]|nr:hypothetical protein [Polyangiaceae bacterium]